MKRTAALLAALTARAVLAQPCPSYSASSATNPGHCATNAAAGTNPTIAQWQALFELAAKGPAAWVDGPAVGDLKDGCSKPMPTAMVRARFPCELVKAIAMQESSWRQFCSPTSPADQVGRPSQTVIASDCGYGVSQVTSGMRTTDALPNYDRYRVAAEPFYNLATGLQILTEKWGFAPCVGDRHPSRLEHWYTATWAYNGLSSINNPNRTGSSTRGVYNPVVGGTVPYQERVWGWLQHPPTPAHWPVTKVAYPRLTDVGPTSPPPALPDPTCGSPTDCTNTRPSVSSSCIDTAADAGLRGDGGADADAGSEPIRIGALDDDLGHESKACGCRSTSGGAVLSLMVLLALVRRRAYGAAPLCL